jgi:outer membrane receptor protein involved in Fe transport
MSASLLRPAVILVTLLSAAVPALALEGRVVDKSTGQPMVNAEVSILGRPGRAVTGADGRFSWQPDPAPPFEVLVVLTGERYTKPVLVEALPSSGPLVIEVVPLLFAEAVTVTAGAAPDIQTTPGNGATLLTSADLESRQPVNLMQALENVPGVSQVSEGHASVPAVRGMARGRTLILIDGARVTSERRVGPSATFLDPFVLESVEVSRGPGSVAYGSDAFGGVIYARTRRAAPGSPLRMRMLGTFGTGVPERRVGVEVSKGTARGGVIAQAHYRNIDDYRSPEGDVFNSGASDRGFVVRGEHEVAAGTLGIGWQSDFGRDIERPRNNSRSVRFFYPSEDSHRLTLNYAIRDLAGFTRIDVDSYAGGYVQVTDQDRFATATAGRSLERGEVSAKDFQVRAAAERPAGPARLEFGVDVNGRFGLEALDTIRAWDLAGGLARDTTSVSIEDAHRTDTGAFGSVELPVVAMLVAGAGLRVDRIVTENTGGFFGDRSTSNAAASGYASTTAGPFAGVTITAQLSRGFRDPVLSDRYFRGPSGRGFITGNPDLQPETSLQFDLAARFTSRRVRLGAFYYQYNINDLVERYQTETDFFFFRNRGEGRIRGFEIESQMEIGWGLTGELAAQIARGLLLDDDTFLDDAPPDNVSLQLRKAIGRGFGQIRVAQFASDRRPGPTEVAAPGYTLVDLSGGVPLTKHLDLRALVRNVLDETYYASPDTRFVFAPGINASVTAVVRF